jgi:hypothetical protein
VKGTGAPKEIILVGERELNFSNGGFKNMSQADTTKKESTL